MVALKQELGKYVNAFDVLHDNLFVNYSSCVRAYDWLTNTRFITHPVIRAFNIGFVPALSSVPKIPITAIQNSLVFPIYDVHKAYQGYTIRYTKDDNKYMGGHFNVFNNKKYILYGIHEAYDYILQEGFVFVVEGAIDCMVLHSYGIRNTIAMLGTSLHDEQLMLLKHFTNKVIVVYDNDDGGRAACMKDAGKYYENVKKYLVPANPQRLKDPDEYVIYYGAENFRETFLRRAKFK